MFVMACTFAIHLSFTSMHTYLKKSNCPHKPLVLWAIQILDQLSILLMHPLCHMKNAFHLGNDRLNKIATDKFHEAFELLNNCISTLRKFECGTRTIPSCPLLQANEARTTTAKLDKAPKCLAGPGTPGGGLVTPDTKRQCTRKANDAEPSTNNLSGTLAYTGANVMPLVNETNTLMHL